MKSSFVSKKRGHHPTIAGQQLLPKAIGKLAKKRPARSPFLPLLLALFKHVTELLRTGSVPHGTVLLAGVSIRLLGLEFNKQKVEAACRKELVCGRAHAECARPEKFLANNWGSVVKLMSIYKRLKAFEQPMEKS